jgi:hypothetical protein
MRWWEKGRLDRCVLHYCSGILPPLQDTPQKKKASQKNPKPYPKKVLINTNNKENSHQKPSDQSLIRHQILTRDKTSKHRIKQLQCKWEGLLILYNWKGQHSRHDM